MEIEKSEQKLITNNDIIGTIKPKIAFKKINEISNFWEDGGGNKGMKKSNH